MIVDYLLFCGIGRVLIYTGQKFPFYHLPWIGKWWKEGGFLKELFDCDFCLGVWAFSILSALFRMNILSGWVYIPGVSELITGTTTSLLVHLLRIGWQDKFGVIVME